MAYATLLLHALLCLGVVALTVMLRRDALGLRTLAPRGEAEDLAAFRRIVRHFVWRLILVVALVIAALVLGALWAPVWRTALPSTVVLNALCIAAGVNVLIAFGKTNRQQWSSSGSVTGLIAVAIWSVIAVGLFVLTLFWRFGG